MRRPPEAVSQEVEATLEERLGRPVRLGRMRPVGGGCINASVRVEIKEDEQGEEPEEFFLKWNETDLFTAEADGLRALREAAGEDGVRVPEVVGVGTGDDGAEAWLLLEFVPQGHPTPEYGSRLGEGLAELHHNVGERFGWDRPNWIGSLPQSNTPSADWPAFWREERLAPQLAVARENGFFTGGQGKVLDRLLERLEELLAGTEEDGPSLLHGDLWSGNVYPGAGGEPVLIDPSVYRGHREVDLAMSQLFGGFPPGFLRAYDEAWPLDDAYEQVRRDVYQLYYLLVHVNLFGASYVERSVEAARRAVG